MKVAPCLGPLSACPQDKGASHACNNLFEQGYKEGETDAKGVFDPDAPLHGVEGVAHVDTWAGGGAGGGAVREGDMAGRWRALGVVCVAWAALSGCGEGESGADAQTAPPQEEAASDPGTVTLRRLNRAEYNNTARDLLGVDLRPADDFPADSHSYGFDNIADVLSISPLQLELYERAAELLAREALRRPPATLETRRFEAEALGATVGARWRDQGWQLTREGRVEAQATVPAGRYRLRVRAFGQQAGDAPVQMALLINGQEVQRVEVTATRDEPAVYAAQIELASGAQRVGAAFLNDLYEPAEGLDRDLIIDWIELEGPDIRGPEVLRVEAEALTPPNGQTTDTGAWLWSDGAFDLPLRLDAAGDYVVVLRAQAQQAGDEDALASVAVNGERRGEVAVDNRAQVALLYEVPLRLEAGAQTLSVGFANDFWEPDLNQDRNLFFDWIALLGPLDRPAPEPAARRRILTCDPAVSGQEPCAREITAAFVARAWRRPVTDEEVARFLPLFDLARQEGDDFEVGVELMIRAALLSPHFLFRVELDPDGDQPHPLGDHELAARMSYFLWSSAPDDALRALADQGRLQEDEVLLAQIERMLDDPRAAALVDHFGGQWLYYNALEDVQPDYAAYPDYSPALQRAMREETRRLFEELMFGDLPLGELLTADWTWANDVLADHYGLDAVEGAALRRVDLRDTTRRGLLTHGSLLTVTSHPTRTSPVRRGKWVLEQLLCSAPPPPPPGVEGLPEAGELRGSVRERTEQHRADPTCASCHQLMDPIGFGLERYDGVGAWRDQDDGFPIDATGALPDGRAFDGALELADLLAQDERLARCASRQLFTYALGRGPAFHDKDDLAMIEAGFRDDGLRLRALARHIIVSEAFRWRRPGAP
jgi:hypothetical protein